MGVDQVGLEPVDQAAQLEGHHRVRERRVVAPVRIAREAGRAGRQGLQPVQLDALVVLPAGEPVVPHRGHRHLVASTVELLAENLDLALGAADERPVEVDGHQDPAGHQPAFG